MLETTHIAPAPAVWPRESALTGERNRLLRAMPPAAYEGLAGRLRTVQLRPQQVLYEANTRITHVYFPQTAAVSLVSGIKGPPIESALIGCEGMVGIPVVAGAAVLPTRAVVEVGGEAKQIEVAQLAALMQTHPAIRDMSTRYLIALLNHTSIEAACNQLHTLVQRCARWFLLASDRAGSSEFRVTHATLSSLLGVRRPSVTIAAGALLRAGVIKYSRGRITITDRAGLEANACPCYGMISRSYEELIPAR
jgi:CRP-like cAMP-binding protein